MSGPRRSRKEKTEDDETILLDQIRSTRFFIPASSVNSKCSLYSSETWQRIGKEITLEYMSLNQIRQKRLIGN